MHYTFSAGDGRLRRRRELGDPPLTQLELAQAAGCSQQMVAALEAGTRRASPGVAANIAKALDCHRDDLFTLEQGGS